MISRRKLLAAGITMPLPILHSGSLAAAAVPSDELEHRLRMCLWNLYPRWQPPLSEPGRPFSAEHRYDDGINDDAIFGLSATEARSAGIDRAVKAAEGAAQGHLRRFGSAGRALVVLVGADYDSVAAWELTAAFNAARRILDASATLPCVLCDYPESGLGANLMVTVISQWS